MEGFSVSLEPNAFLEFHRPLRHGRSCSLTITNNNNQPIAYKVKTTAPRSYCVRPNCGRVEPLKRVTITISLEPMKEEPSSDACKDKFLIESTLIDPKLEEHILPLKIFSLIKSSGELERVHNQKLKVKFLAPLWYESGPSAKSKAPRRRGILVRAGGFALRRRLHKLKAILCMEVA